MGAGSAVQCFWVGANQLDQTHCCSLESIKSELKEKGKVSFFTDCSGLELLFTDIGDVFDPTNKYEVDTIRIVRLLSFHVTLTA